MLILMYKWYFLLLCCYTKHYEHDELLKFWNVTEKYEITALLVLET